MTRHKRHQPSIVDTLKDYAVPLIGGILILFIIYSVFFGKGNEAQESIPESTQSTNAYEIQFESSDTQAEVIYVGGKKETLSESQKVFPGESIVVQEGAVSLSSPDGDQVSLAKIAELEIQDTGDYNLYSSDAWFQLKNDRKIQMRFANISAPAGSIFSLTQNEAGSTAYVLKGLLQIENIVGVKTFVSAGQKISIPRLEASNKDFDITNEKAPLDSFFKSSDWFLQNEGQNIVIEETTSTDNIPENLEGLEVSEVYIRFDTLRDEMSVQAGSIDVSGTILSEKVGSISIENIQAEINTTNKSFQLANIPLPKSINDIVVKIYDTEKKILEKNVYTIYSSTPSTSAGNTQAQNTQNQAQAQNAQTNVTNFAVDATKFRFTEPSTSGKFSTSSSEVTIRGITSAENIARVEVNGFNLNSFNGSTWRYHAFERFETLSDGTNQYRIDYYGNNGKLVYTDYFTIVKKDQVVAPVTPPVSQSTTETQEESSSSETNPDISSQEPENLFAE